MRIKEPSMSKCDVKKLILNFKYNSYDICQVEECFKLATLEEYIMDSSPGEDLYLERYRRHQTACTILLHKIIQQHLRSLYIILNLANNTNDPDYPKHSDGDVDVMEIHNMYHKSRSITLSLIEDAAVILYPQEMAQFSSAPREMPND